MPPTISYSYRGSKQTASITTAQMAGFAHQVCNSLRQGQPEAQVVQWLAAALGMHQQWAALFVNDVKVSYPNCGTHTDNF
jgi:hypothetical protein